MTDLEFVDGALDIIRRHGWTNLEVATGLNPGGALISFELLKWADRPGVEIQIREPTAEDALVALERRLVAIGDPS
ncbi:MAG: hypothetical protein M3406_09085 [Chloroflexota bacterium]|nr:hypothetical protein [Chloroflexota bacterium]